MEQVATALLPSVAAWFPISCCLPVDDDHRDLHSFPTRRSSDLGRRRERRGLPAPRARLRAGLAQPRSEEHTSELQSQSNLVCRLLLEKKKSFTISGYELRRARQSCIPPCP